MEVKTPSQVGWYRAKGYDLRADDVVTIDVVDLPPHSRVAVDAQCEVCGEVRSTTKAQHTELVFKYERFVCRTCAIQINAKRTFDDLYLDFKERGMYLVPRQVLKRTTQYLDYYCIYHPDVVQSITYNSFQQGSGCRFCARVEHSERMMGRGNPAWAGGSKDLALFLRRGLRWWFNREAGAYGYRCALSGGDFQHVHHTYPYHLVVAETLDKLGLEPMEAGDYTDEELVKIQDAVRHRHESIVGIPLTQPLHQLFHRMYGSKRFTVGDYYEFERKYKDGEFDV
jgi:hypothetical protein